MDSIKPTPTVLQQKQNKTKEEFEKKVLAICWGLQLISAAAGGQVKKSTTGTHVGIAVDIELTDNGINHPVYKSKSKKFNTVNKIINDHNGKIDFIPIKNGAKINITFLK